MIARATQFLARHYLNWSAIKMAFFLGALTGMVAQSVLIALVLAGHDLSGLVP
jgi:hypothetical protein